MRAGLTISTIVHVALLLWGLVAFVAKPLDAAQVEPMPVDIVNAKDFAQMTAGQKNAKPAEKPKPLVEKVAEAKPVEDTTAKISEKKEIAPTAAAEPPPLPPSKPEKQVKPEPPKPDPIAEALKKEEQKPKEEQKAEAKPVPTPPKRPTPQPTREHKFDPNKIAALLDKREPRRQAATGETMSDVPTLGTSTGRAAELSATYLNALVSRLRQCWKPDGGALVDEQYKIPVTVRFNQDGTLASAPQLDMTPRSERERVVAEGVTRAIIACQPYTMLPRAQYADWKELPFSFCTKEDGRCS
jgi:colicin import membrane protein